MITRNFGRRVVVAAIGAWLAAAGVIVGFPPAAQAADQLGGIATGPNGQWSLWWNYQPVTAAYFGTWQPCGYGCSKKLLFEQCGALAYNGGAFSPAEGSSLDEAQANAMADLPGGWIVASHCNDGGAQDQIAWRPWPPAGG